MSCRPCRAWPCPEPRPALAQRPRKLSVSRVETWIGNPYAIFAREVLSLEPLAPLGEQPGPSLRGSIIHDALSEFAKAYPVMLQPISKASWRLRRTSLDSCAHPRIAAFWIPRFERFAVWFAATEPRRRAGIGEVKAEVSGAMVFAAPAGLPFTSHGARGPNRHFQRCPCHLRLQNRFAAA